MVRSTAFTIAVPLPSSGKWVVITNIGVIMFLSSHRESKYPLAIAFFNVSVRLSPGLMPFHEPLNSQGIAIPCALLVIASSLIPIAGMLIS